MVEIEILHEDDKSMQLLLKKTDRALANALRRTMIADVPKFAIHRMRMDIGMIVDEADGETYESLGAMSDEMLGHRCAMVPVPTFFEKEEHIPRYFQDECPDCKDLVPEQRGCPQCSVIYAIEQKGTEEGHTVTAEHLVVMGDMNRGVSNDSAHQALQGPVSEGGSVGGKGTRPRPREVLSGIRSDLPFAPERCDGQAAQGEVAVRP